MTDKHITVDSIRWNRVLPCLHLLGAAQLALRVRVVLLSLCAVAVFGIGQVSIEKLPFYSRSGSLPPVLSVLNSSPATFIGSLDSRIEGHRWCLAWPWVTAGHQVAHVVVPGTNDRKRSWSDLATDWTGLLWNLLVWGVFGGAISRMHAVRFARDESLSPIRAVPFTARLWQSYIYAPLLPILGVCALSLVGIVVGQFDAWLAGGNGDVLLWLGWLPMLCSLLMAALLLLILASWPLMVAAISVEGSDGFDGLSRAFGYVMNRPWYFLFLVVIALGVGWLTDTFVVWLVSLTMQLANWTTVGRGAESFSAWMLLLSVLHLAALTSYFWSATTVIYFLLRQCDDGTPLDQVYIPGPPPKAEPLPLVGVAASRQPVIERPATDAGDAPSS